MSGHPERSLPRFLRQTESKDLHLFFNEFRTHHTGDKHGGVFPQRLRLSTQNRSLRVKP